MKRLLLRLKTWLLKPIPDQNINRKKLDYPNREHQNQNLYYAHLARMLDRHKCTCCPRHRWKK